MNDAMYDDKTKSLIYEISATINEILIFRGISDDGKNFDDEVETHIYPFIKKYVNEEIEMSEKSNEMSNFIQNSNLQ